LTRQAGGCLVCDEAADPGVVRSRGRLQGVLQSNTPVLGQTFAKGGEKSRQASGGSTAASGRDTCPAL
jgi:hypothetical protein